MAYETKVILAALAERVAVSETIEEAYGVIRRAANVEGANLPTYEEYKAELSKEKKSK